VVKAEVLELGVSYKSGSGHKLPSIVVHGDKNGYSIISTDTLTYYMSVKMNYPKLAEGPSPGRITLENSSVSITPYSKTKTYKISMPYMDPRAYKSRISPVDICNDWLNSKSGNNV